MVIVYIHSIDVSSMYIDYKDDSLHLLVSITGCSANISFLSMRKDGPKVVEK